MLEERDRPNPSGKDRFIVSAKRLQRDHVPGTINCHQHFGHDKSAPTGIAFLLLLFLLLTNLTLAPHVHAQGDSVTIQITGPGQPPGFSPALLTVHVNDTLVFVNQSAPPAAFAVSAADGGFSSPAIAPGAQWTVTFTSTGSHEYHEANNATRMVGEVLVVPNSVALLPTPNPEAEATVLAAIEAGRSPPDTIVLPTPTAVPVKAPATASAASPLPWILLALALVGGGAGFLLLRRRRSRLRAQEEFARAMTGPLASTVPALPTVQAAAPAKKVRMLALSDLLQRLWRNNDEEDEDDLDFEGYEDV